MGVNGAIRDATLRSGVGRRPTRWKVAPLPGHAIVAQLMSDLLLPESICALLAVRGFHTPEKARTYLRPKFEQLCDGMLMLGMDRAVERLERAVRAGERILVHGDYDVDGICSTTLLTLALRGLGADVVPFIPHRLENGYDLGDAGVDAALAAGAGVVITCDCGTSAHAAVRRLVDAGVSVIVTDHHLPSEKGVPECTAVLNPRQKGCTYPDKDLAGVGVAFKLAREVVVRLNGSEESVFGMLDLVALATVADIAPLRGENRVFVRHGLRLLRETRNRGLRALIRSAGLTDKPITAGRVGFILAPRLNAVGRLGRAMRGVELLLSESEYEANAIARELEEVNLRRQEIDRATLVKARDLVAGIPESERFGLVLAHEGWHPGVVGIVASRIVEETGCPAILIAVQDGQGKGSGRSIPAFDLHGGLTSCAVHLERFGGHRSAAGVTIRAECIPAFASQFNEIVRSTLSPEDFAPEVNIDLQLGLGEQVVGVERYLRHFEPFGVGNAAPVFMTRGVRVVRAPRRVGENGIRFCVAADGAELDVLGWGFADRSAELSPGSMIDVAYRVEREFWNGMSSVQGRLVDFRPADV